MGISFMRKVASLFKQLQIAKVLLIFVAGFMLFFSVACSATETGARPHNPPVQAGGANNPYKGSGDSYTQYKQPSNPNVSLDQSKS
ncbi:hypothetical protein C7B61_10925 [filamentous cyanobacterium CCP1]|nr:hypothetical protein C7B76_01290 [filamentous cyanobacterium CCP2]PSB65793.1 hypothetical protein C7B61_10925 [filamentous cyanobacterium CCP1]